MGYGYRETGVGEGDIELARDFAVKMREGREMLDLAAGEPPAAQSVYVCRWCFRIVERDELNWVDGNGEHVCDGCADGYLTTKN